MANPQLANFSKDSKVGADVFAMRETPRGSPRVFFICYMALAG